LFYSSFYQPCGSEVIVQKVCGLAICCLFIFGGSSISLNASPREFQNATVVSAEKYEPPTVLHRKVTDAPAPSYENDFNVSIRLNCVVYLGRYKSAFAYVPSVFAAGQSVEVSPGKTWLYVKVPGTGEVKLRIVRRDPVAGDSCKASH